MSLSPPLAALASACGIAPDYWDIAGRQHVLRDETARALLGTLGMEAADDAACRRSLEAVAETERGRALPPVVTIREGETATVPILPGGPRIDWTLALEDGRRREGRARSDDLAVRDGDDPDGTARKRRHLPLPDDLPLGYHRLKVGSEGPEMTVIVVPARGHLPPAFAQGRKLWGLAAQLYSVRSARNWGIGDFGDLARLVEMASGLGAGVVGLNPLHVLDFTEARLVCPYAPSSRYFIDSIYLDIAAIPDLAEAPDARERLSSPAMSGALEGMRRAALIDYEAISRAKREILEHIYRAFRAHHPDHAEDSRGAEFRKFREQGGERLRRYALFEALAEHCGTQRWQSWPSACADPLSAACRKFAREREDRLDFFAYLQFLADEQLGAAAGQASESGLEIGLYRDLALGIHPAGADSWIDRGVLIEGASIGAPPDPFSPNGQDWGIRALHPRALREAAYAPFIDALKANMRHAGALRIDHAMMLTRLFLVPEGSGPADGAYLRYPFDEMLGIVALESQRNRCLVVGEDLGTVPEGFRDALEAANVYSMRILYFEKADGRLRMPEAYPAHAVASTATHDLPTLKGFWSGLDLALQDEPPEGQRESQKAARARDRRAFLDALAEEGLLPEGLDRDAAERAPMSPKLSAAIHRFLARSGSDLVLAQLDDLAGEETQINLPSAPSSPANWRRRQRRDLEEIVADPHVLDLAAAILAERERA